MAKVASLLLVAVLVSLISSDSHVFAQGVMVTRISDRCRGAKPTKLTRDEKDKARKTAQWAASQNWKIDSVEVNKCSRQKLTEVLVKGRTANNEDGSFLFFDSHNSFRKALTLHPGLEMKVEYTSIDQDTLWSEGEEGSLVKFLRISKVE